MRNIKIGDIVARKSYSCDILFEVIDIEKTGQDDVYTLRGVCYRIEADAHESDLILQSESHVREYKSKMNEMVGKKTKDICTGRKALIWKG